MIKQSYLFTIIEARVTAESNFYTMEFTAKKEIYITIHVSIAKLLFYYVIKVRRYFFFLLQIS